MGTIVVNQIPMIMTFDEDHAEAICQALADALEQSYQYISMFGEYEDEGEEL